MDKVPDSTAGQIYYLLRRIHVRKMHIMGPIVIAMVAAVFEGVGMGLLIPILTGFLQKSFSFILEAPYIGPVMQMLPDTILENDRWLFGILLGGFIIIYVLKSILRFLAVVGMSYFTERTIHLLRKELFARYMRFGKMFFDTTHLGHHNVVLMEFSRQALQPLTSIDRYINALFSLVVYGVIMLFISWRLTLFAFPLFIMLHLMVKFIIVRIRNLSHATSARGMELNSKSVEILSSMALVKAYRMETKEQKHYSEISHDKANLHFKAVSLLSLVHPVQEVVTMLMVSTIFVGALTIFGREQIASASALIVYFYIVMNATSKLSTLSGLRGTLANCSGPLQEILAVFSDKGKYFVTGGSDTFKGLQQEITFKNLTFSYADRDVLSDVSFSIPKEKMTAIVGPSGSGKSTLIHLLMRFYDCPADMVFVDGKDIRSFSLDSYMEHVAIVSQETVLLHDSLRNNIAYGLSDVSEEAIQDVVQRARLSDFVDQLPNGLDTLIGDRGVMLSGGEKQRVSIARALLKESDILILDEATSSLDSQTEKLIQEAIDEAVVGRTAIVIAHRLSTIRHADSIVVLKDGALVEEGTLDDLLEKGGLFHHLWEEQKF